MDSHLDDGLVELQHEFVVGLAACGPNTIASIVDGKIR